VGEGTYYESLIINKVIHLVAQNGNVTNDGSLEDGDGTISLLTMLTTRRSAGSTYLP
jgi:hypothetical protein